MSKQVIVVCPPETDPLAAEPHAQDIYQKKGDLSGEKHRVCARSGFMGRESEMVKVRGRWILKKFMDTNEGDR